METLLLPLGPASADVAVRDTVVPMMAMASDAVISAFGMNFIIPSSRLPVVLRPFFTT